MTDVREKQRPETERKSCSGAPVNKARAQFEALSRASDRVVDIASREIDQSLTGNSEAYNRTLRQQTGE